ncbi:hypothetical protein ILUMI_05701 [Ignelater luminosus]|uniref:Uncharacterized protein n=1 Tax=Ignelater luminosus TaxID=2038154 RepID=A0A8K0DBF5_IGNLU|nr:hypothetical protein ILUMI_05701 [Ignelater luminosus]
MISGNACEPSLVNSVFDYLKNETLKSDFVRDVALTVDGMSIRSQMCVDQKENSLRGYVDYGEAGQELNIKYNSTELATEMLAFQIFKQSAVALLMLDFLREFGNTEFQGSKGTVKFIRKFDMLFDMFNSRNAYGKGFKSSLSLKNIEHWSQKVEECNEYIRNLMLDGKQITTTKRKAFAVRFIVNGYSFHQLALDLLTAISKPLKYFLPYKCFQDNIKLYFCCIRPRGGWNNNPNVLQALWWIRRLLYRNSVTPGINADCLFDDSESVPIFKFRSAKRNVIEENQANNDIEMEKLMLELENVEMSTYQENILFYITGYIVDLFMKTCTYTNCQDILTEPKNDRVYSTPQLNHYSGINSVILTHFLPKLATDFNPQHPITETLDGFSERHELRIIKFIATKYAKIRLLAYSKIKTLQYLGEKTKKNHELRLCPKLADFHVITTEDQENEGFLHFSGIQSMVSCSFLKTKAEFSAVASLSCQISPKATETAELLLFCDKLFDSVNGSTSNPQFGKEFRSAITSTSPHLAFWVVLLLEQGHDLRKRMNILRHIDIRNVTELSPKVRKLFRTASGLRKIAKRFDVECEAQT